MCKELRRWRFRLQKQDEPAAEQSRVVVIDADIFGAIKQVGRSAKHIVSLRSEPWNCGGDCGDCNE